MFATKILRRFDLPTYEYKCLSCGINFEKFQSMKEDPLKICPECNGEIKRLIGAGAGPIFKGSGFYQTDYKNSSNKTDKSTSTNSNPSESKTKNISDSNGTTDKK